MRFYFNFSLIFTGFATLFFAANTMASTPFSQYGMIQNVRDYSTNPFYNPETATIATPKIIYANGPALKPTDCQNVVATVVAAVCAQRNMCQNTKLTDVRPDIMVSLSTLPGHNYASACSGYIDTIFKQYTNTPHIKMYNAASGTEFPTPQTTTIATTFPTATTNTPKWQQEYNERANELRALQQATKTTNDTVVATDFPKTFNDLSFEERNKIKQMGYEPFKDAQVYIPIHVEIEKKTEKTATATATAQTSAQCDFNGGLAQGQTAQGDCAGLTIQTGISSDNAEVCSCKCIDASKNKMSCQILACKDGYEKKETAGIPGCVEKFSQTAELSAEPETPATESPAPAAPAQKTLLTYKPYGNNETKCIKTTQPSVPRDDHFCYYSPNYRNVDERWCFKADTNYCRTNTTVCILGYTLDNKHRSKTEIKECKIAYATNAGGDDTWDKYTARDLPDCTSQKWKQNNDPKKTTPVMVANPDRNTEEVILDGEYPAKYFIKQYDAPKYPDICIGYFCPDDGGKFQEPNEDGTCK